MLTKAIKATRKFSRYAALRLPGIVSQTAEKNKLKKKHRKKMCFFLDLLFMIR